MCLGLGRVNISANRCKEAFTGEVLVAGSAIYGVYNGFGGERRRCTRERHGGRRKKIEETSAGKATTQFLLAAFDQIVNYYY